MFQLSSGGAAAQADTGQEIGCIIMFQLLQPPLPSDNIASKHYTHWRFWGRVSYDSDKDWKHVDENCWTLSGSILPASIQQQKARNASANSHSELRTIFIPIPCLFPPLQSPASRHIKKCVRRYCCPSGQDSALLAKSAIFVQFHQNTCPQCAHCAMCVQVLASMSSTHNHCCFDYRYQAWCLTFCQ